ncbi:MAG: hypothetical protein IJA41_03845 [Clostridia bacterium]|nr:hypothetical protein [Clostridia bacterium]
MKEYKGLFIANVIFTVLNWLVALPFFLFNLLGLWELWHISGYFYLVIFAIPLLISFILTVISAVIAYKLHQKKSLTFSFICFGISISAVVFTFLVSAVWLW